MVSTRERLKKQRLKKVSDLVYQEADPPANRHRPLEWRRGFNSVYLPLRNVQMVSNFSVHDLGWDLHDKHDDSPWQKLKPKIGTQRFIQAILDESKFKDVIYCALVDDSDKSIVELERLNGETQLFLKPGVPTKGDDKFAGGLYGGSCFRMKHGPGDDYLCFELYLPPEQINNVLDSLGKDPTMHVEVGVYLLSFSYEVDSLREWYDPQRLFIEDHADAATMMVKTSSAMALNSSNENRGGTNLELSKIDFSPITSSLGRLTLAMWVLVAIIGYVLVK